MFRTAAKYAFRVCNRLAIVLLFAAMSVACAGLPEPSPPEWLRHHAPPQVEAIDREALRVRLIAELAEPESHDAFLKPEEIAVAALSALRAGETADACLLLAAADYRYHQEARRVARQQEQTRKDPRFLDLDLPRQQLVEMLFSREVSVYAQRDFRDALAACVERLTGDAQSSVITLEEVERVLLGQEPSHRDWLAGLGPVSPASRWLEGLSVDAELRSALHRRLREDGDTPELARRGFELLAALPFDEYLDTALTRVSSMAEPLLLRALLRYAINRDDLKNSFAARFGGLSPALRSNLAILAGLVPGFLADETLGAAARQETDPFVRLSLVFALAARGDKEAWDLLTGAATTREGSPFPLECREHAISLLVWMPDSHPGEVTPELLTQILEASRGHYVALVAALAFVERMAPRVEAQRESVAFIMARLRFMDDDLLLERLTAALAAIPLLDRATLMSTLEITGHPRQRAALLVRFGKLARADDVSRLWQWWERFPDWVTRREILRVIAGLPGDEAASALWRVYAQTDGEGELRRMAGLLLALRRDVPPAFADALLENGEAEAVEALALMGDPRALPLLHAELTQADAARRFTAVELIALLGLEGFEAPLWRQVGYINPRIYPHDAILRHAALNALFSLELRGGLR